MVPHKLTKYMKKEKIKSVGWDEAWCEWFECPKCKNKDITISSNYCPNCGFKIKKK